MLKNKCFLLIPVLVMVQIGLFGQDGMIQKPGSLDVGAKPSSKAVVLFDGTRQMLDEKWTYWQGPRLAATLPIKWFLVDDPQGSGKVLNTNDPTAAGGKYGTADIVTKEAYRDFRLHIEFLIVRPGWNSGVYLQNRYEIQVLD